MWMGKRSCSYRREGYSFRARRVRVGRHSDSVVEIVSGLQAGEKVVVAGAFRLKSELLKAQMIEE